MNQTNDATDEIDVATASPQDLVDMSYRLISFAAGGEPSWDLFRQLFSDRAVFALRILPTDESISIFTLDEFVRHFARAEMKESGYEERPLERSINVMGDLAEVHARFQMYVGTRHIGDAIDIFLVVRRGGRWSIVSLTSEVFGHQAAYESWSVGRHRVAADHYRELRRGTFASWDGAVAIWLRSGGRIAVVAS